MTTEQMDWLDDQRNFGNSTAYRRRAAAEAGPVILYGHPSKEELAAARGVAGSRGVMVLPEEMRGSTIASGGGWWSPTPDETMENLTPPADEPAPETEPWKNVADSCDKVIRATLEALGFEMDTDPVLAARKRMQQLEEAKAAVKAAEYVTLAPEPIEDRLRRAWLNGFRDGVDRASFAATESTGKWDY